ncbi:MAG: phosphodiesterase [Gammaproteobacteria bacterium]|nr:phosphodiesterase [Gammaproteobacteria bacterium]
MHLTDPHLFADAQADLRGTVTYSSLCDVLEHYRKSDWSADLAVVTGDLIQDDSAGAYVHFCQLLGTIGLPVHCVPGNHDIRALMRDALAAPPFHYCDSVQSGNWLIIGIDSCVTGQAGGHVTDSELERLEETIAAAAEPNAMVCLHHPPVPMGSQWLDTVGLDNGDEFLRRVRDMGKVRLAIFGHVHQPYDADHGGVRIIGTPSTCRQFAQASEDFALDDSPPAYRRITLLADGSFEHDLVWLNK